MTATTYFPAPARRVHLPSVIGLAVLACVLGFVMVTATLSPLKDDVAWLLYVARKWLGGQRLYEDLVEVNPPLIIWLYAAPAWVAETLGIAPKTAANPFFAALLLGSAWWTACLLRGRHRLFAHRAPVFATIASLLLLLPGIEFGQREHLLAAAILPYLALFVRELDGEPEPRATAIFAGILAGLGCALKPTYVLAFLLIELLAWMRGRRIIRAATLSAGLTMALYGAAVLIFCPAFLDKAVPLALALYGATDTPCWDILLESRRLLFGQAVVLLLCWGGRDLTARTSPFLRHLLLALTLFSIGATVVFVLQGKNWFYHRLPATLTTVMALMIWLAAALPELTARLRATPRPNLRLAQLFAVCLAFLALADFSVANYDRLRPWVDAAVEPNQSTEVKLSRLIKREKAKTYIAFSEWIALGFPVVDDTGVAWTSRFDSMWALKGEMWRARQEGGAPKEWPIRRWVARDFVAGCPDLAVVDMRGGTNYVAVLVASDPDFARAWNRYKEIATFDGLRVLKRNAAGCGAEMLPRVAAAEPAEMPVRD